MGTVVDGVYYNTDSPLAAPGGFLDRLTNTVDQANDSAGQLRGFAPALAATGIPVSAPPSIFSRIIGGITGQPPAGASAAPPAAPQMPLASASGSTVPGAVGGGGNPADYFSQVRALESGGRNVDNGQGSGATGPYQFLPGTWAGVAKAHPELGLTSAGIHDPQQQEVAMRAFTADNAGVLGRALGRPPTPGELYLAHQQGPEGAVGLLTNPGARASDIVGHAAIVGNGGAPDMTAGQFAGMWGSKFGGAPASASAPGTMAYAGAQPARAAAPAVGAMASMMGGDPSAAQRPTVGASGKPPMPQASADQADPNGSGQSPQGAPTTSQVQALLANPATRAQGMQLWQRMRAQAATVGAAPQPTSAGPQPAAGPAPMTLPGGLTPEALRAMIQEPATRAAGLALWQQTLQPKQAQFGNPGQAIVINGRVTGQIPSNPVDLGPGHALVPSTGGAPIAAVPPNLDHGPIGTDPETGKPVYGSINTQTGAASPFAATSAPQGAGDQNLTGQAFLDSLPKGKAAQIQAVAEGRLPLPTGQGANAFEARRLRGQVLQYKPDFDTTDTAARAETRKDFATGTTANTITALNTALHHAGLLSDAGEELAASQIPIFNSAGQKIETAAGANLAGKRYAAAQSALADEMTKAYRGSGGTEADINEAKALISPDQSPAQRRAGIAQLGKLLQGKVLALQDRWHQGMGPQAKDYPLIQQDATDALARINARAPVDPAGAPGAGSAGPLPIAAPAGASRSPSGGTQPPVPGAHQAPDGRFYTPDPARPGKYLRVDP